MTKSPNALQRSVSIGQGHNGVVALVRASLRVARRMSCLDRKDGRDEKHERWAATSLRFDTKGSRGLVKKVSRGLTSAATRVWKKGRTRNGSLNAREE